MPASERARENMEKIEKIDEAMAVEVNPRVAIAQQMSEEEFLDNEKSLKRKLDLRLTSMIVFIYILNFLDRVGIKIHCRDELLLSRTGRTILRHRGRYEAHTDPFFYSSFLAFRKSGPILSQRATHD
jgi:hypothetical protein